MKGQGRTRLDLYRRDASISERGWPIRVIWYMTNILFFKSSWCVWSGFKSSILKIFGANVGAGLVIKPLVNIKYPWKLSIGQHVWMGENTWIDNLEQVTIGDHSCLSQGCLILTGNHDFNKATFDLKPAPVIIENGAWVGAKAVVCPGVTVHSHAVLTVGSVATSDLQPYMIYQGNPAQAVKERQIVDR